jgi:putative ABC transport system ATP-binding protein
VELDAGQLLFRQGDASDLIYVLESGELEVMRESPEGGDVLLNVVSPGDYVGEMGPLFGLNRSATVRARVPSALTGYSVKAFRNLVGDQKIPALIRGRAQP